MRLIYDMVIAFALPFALLGLGMSVLGGSPWTLLPAALWALLLAGRRAD